MHLNGRIDCFTFFLKAQGLGNGLEGAVVTGAGDAEQDWQHDESVVSGEENDEEENLKSHGNIITINEEGADADADALVRH